MSTYNTNIPLMMNNRPVYKANSTTKCHLQTPEEIACENSNKKSTFNKMANNVMIPRLMVNFATGSETGKSAGSRHESIGSSSN
jgi:hypothetical protein